MENAQRPCVALEIFSVNAQHRNGCLISGFPSELKRVGRASPRAGRCRWPPFARTLAPSCKLLTSGAPRPFAPLHDFRAARRVLDCGGPPPLFPASTQTRSNLNETAITSLSPLSGTSFGWITKPTVTPWAAFARHSVAWEHGKNFISPRAPVAAHRKSASRNAPSTSRAPPPAHPPNPAGCLPAKSPASRRSATRRSPFP